MIRSAGLLIALLVVGCSPDPTPVATEPLVPATPTVPVVRSLSTPVGWLVDRLAPTGIDHVCVLPPDADPATWRPAGDLVVELAQADLIIANGAGYEPWTVTASLPSTRLIDTSRGLPLIEHDVQTHSHGPGSEEHAHGEVDPHIFLDPGLFGRQATRVAAALKTVLADDAAVDARLQTLQAELDALGQEWDDTLRPQTAGAHRDWSYLLARVGKEATGSGLDVGPLVMIGRAGVGSYDYLDRSRAAIARVRGAGSGATGE